MAVSPKRLIGLANSGGPELAWEKNPLINIQKNVGQPPARKNDFNNFT